MYAMRMRSKRMRSKRMRSKGCLFLSNESKAWMEFRIRVRACVFYMHVKLTTIHVNHSDTRNESS